MLGFRLLRDDDDTQTQMQRSARLESSPPPQFDSSDLGSPKKVWSLLCTKDETYRRDPRLFQRQRKINAKMRSMLFDWLMDVCADKHMHRETFHLCVDYFDRYIALDEQVAPNRLQLIGATALIIASKIEEIYPPKVSEIADYTDGCCEEQDLRDLEEVMLQRLHWKCYPITAVHWLALYMQLMNTCDVLPARQVILTAEKPVKKEPKAQEKTIKKEELSRTPPERGYGGGAADEEEDVEDEPIAVAYMPTSNFSYDELPSLNVSIVSEMEEEQTPPRRLLEQYQKQQQQPPQDSGSNNNGKQPKLELFDMSYEEAAGMSTATAAVVVKQEPAEEETETENHKPPAASASAMDQGQNSPIPNSNNNNSIVSTPKAVIKANNTSSISGGGGNNNTNDKHHHHRRRVLTFSTVCPRMQLGRIGGSPRVLLHTAMADISYVGHSNYSAGHIYPDQRCTVPKLMRGEFVRLASILDLVTLDASSLRYTYRELATAVLLCSYEPEHLICQIGRAHV